MKKKYKTLTKRLATLTLTALIVFSSVFSSYGMTANAQSTSVDSVDDWLNEIAEDTVKNLIDAIRSGSYVIGAELGKSAGNLYAPGVGGAVGSVAGAFAIGSLTNGVLDYFTEPTETQRVHGGDGRTFNYIKNTGKPTSQNSSSYNKTSSMSVYNEVKTFNNTTNNYDYNFKWYNPITNNYDITNEYYYNAEYNTYNYVTHNYEITNNYNYTTNYYIQDNRTYVSYYIINTCDETGEEEETYIEMYYQLPDGRNSFDLTVDDIKGMYFPSNYSKYISVAEDDGTTLGLWHLDGDLKDSSYWGNTAGSSYQNVYTDGLYTNGKKFSDSDNDFLELKLDKVDLPSSWTLEWYEYIPSADLPSVFKVRPDWEYDISRASDESFGFYFYDDSHYDLIYDIYLDGFLSVKGDNVCYNPSSGYFIPYAITCNNGDYKFYSNGNLIEPYDFSNYSIYPYYLKNNTWTSQGAVNVPTFNPVGDGLTVDSDSIKFSAERSLVLSSKSSGYIYGQVDTSDSDTIYHNSHAVYNVYLSSHKNAIIDEVRLSSGVLYSGSSYTPQSQPYTTNTVLAVPSNPEKHEIAFKTNTNISDVRFGGVRPTYPTNGYVYVALDSSHKVESVQQYQEDGWYEIESSIYSGTDWVSFKGFNMEYLGVDGVDPDTGGDTGGGSDSGDTGDTGDSGGGSGITDIINGIGKFFDTILSILGKLIGMLSDFLYSALSMFETLTVFTDGFSKFLGSAFVFLPPEAISVLVSGITLLVVLAIIRFLK